MAELEQKQALIKQVSVDKIINMSSFKMIVPAEHIVYSQKLYQSIKEHKILLPVYVSQGFLCDGHKRVAIAHALGIDYIQAAEITLPPIVSFVNLNTHRNLSLPEIISIWDHLKNKNQDLFFSLTALSSSPALLEALEYLSNNPELASDEITHMPLNTWRELGGLGKQMSFYAPDLSKLKATVSEKRLIAQLLKLCYKKSALPPSLKYEEPQKILDNLRKIAEPKRTAVQKKLAQALCESGNLQGIKIIADPNFEKSGLTLSMHITRNNMHKIEQAKTLLKHLFDQVQEL